MAVAQGNLRKFMDLIQHNQVDKVSKLLDRGFDPNYHDSETGGKAARRLAPHVPTYSWAPW